MVSPTPQPALQQSQGITRDVSKPQTYSVHRIAPRLSSAPFQTGSSRVINVTLLGPGRGLPRQTPQHYAGPLESPVFLPIGLHAAEPSPTTGISLPLPLFRSSSTPLGRFRHAAIDEGYVSVTSGLRVSSGAFESVLQAPRGGTAIPIQRPSSLADAVTRSLKQQSANSVNSDGYNWQKYGEKLVKDSPYPRCYYRCMFPGCSVKKAVERDPVGGNVSSTIYKLAVYLRVPIHIRSHLKRVLRTATRK